MSRELQTLAVLVIGAILLQACATKSLYDTCLFGDPDEVNPNSLGVVLGAPADRFNKAPFIVFSTPSGAKPVETVKLNLEAAPMPWPQDLDETPCKGVDWRTYRAAVDPDQWAKFWALPRPLPVETGVGFTDSMTPFRYTEFAYAIFDIETGEIFESCGCYGI